MGLEGLAPELFCGIIHEYVELVGIKEACKARVVCKLFDANIRDEILIEQPIKAFGRFNSQAFLDTVEHGGQYIYNRCIKLLDASPQLTTFIDDILGSLPPRVNVATRYQRKVNLCRHIARSAQLDPSNVAHLIEHGWVSNGRVRNLKANATDKIVGAVIVDDVTALRTAMQQVSSMQLFFPANFFSGPLQDAIQLRANNMVGMILNRMLLSGAFPPDVCATKMMRFKKDTLSDSIWAAMQIGDFALARMLYNWRHTHIEKYKPGDYNNLLWQAMYLEGPAAVDFVLNLKTPRCKVKWGTFYKAIGKFPADKLAKLLGGRSGLEVNKYYSKVSTPLIEAIKKGKVDDVRAVLDAGAWPDGVPPKGSFEYAPLCYAAEKNDPAKCQLLVDRGAQVFIRGRQFDPLDLAWSHGPDGCYEILRKGKSAQMGIPIKSWAKRYGHIH
ncbi:hypothetical protein EJ04DRAFT_524814 [Polyplosphaeria fusca]|uniref:Uncharacterized protein n=1 Tax=Polyplosphaeria fusca TaxID=682080 RepID=A0A9P4QY65_9PLEO|nr:hypothetical protein EJ04DRAFT_524814 [Polyplosphaeria fusca]